MQGAHSSSLIMKKKLLLFLILALGISSLWAKDYDFNVDNIYYQLISPSECAVCNNGSYNTYSGTISIPSTVIYQDKILNVTNISSSAFRGCSRLVSVNIPNSIIKMGSDVFKGCTSLTSIEIPSSVVEIGSSAFSGCYSLSSCIIQPGLKKLDSWFFQNCSSLQNFIIPSTVAEVSNQVFVGCDLIKDIIVDPQNEYLKTIDGVLFSADLSSIISYPCSRRNDHYSIPEGVKTIEYTFLNQNPYVTSLTIPQSVTTVKMHGLNGNPNLSKIRILATVPPTCASGAFGWNDNLTITLEVPQGCVDVYKSSYEWKKCWKIIEFTDDADGKPDAKKQVATPMISYENGKISFTCETKNVTYTSFISSSDFCAYNTSEINISATYNISVYASAEGYDRSITATATLCWLESEPKTEGINNLTRLNSTPVLISSNGNYLNISGAENIDHIEFYNLLGAYLGAEQVINGEASFETNENFVIVKIGEKSIKVKK